MSFCNFVGGTWPQPGSGLEDEKELTLPRRIAIVVALLLMSAAGFAQIPTSGNVFLGYSLNHASTGWNNTGNLNGWELSAEGKMVPHVGIVADLSSQYGTLQTPNRYLYGGTSGTFDLKTQMESYLFGPRVSVTVGKFRPFANVLVGAAHLHEDALDYGHGETCAADAIGGGLDYQLRSRLTWRVQGDLLQTRFHNGLQEDIRISTGLAMNF